MDLWEEFDVGRLDALAVCLRGDDEARAEDNLAGLRMAGLLRAVSSRRSSVSARQPAAVLAGAIAVTEQYDAFKRWLLQVGSALLDPEVCVQVTLVRVRYGPEQRPCWKAVDSRGSQHGHRDARKHILCLTSFLQAINSGRPSEGWREAGSGPARILASSSKGLLVLQKPWHSSAQWRFNYFVRFVAAVRRTQYAHRHWLCNLKLAAFSMEICFW